MSYIEPVRTTTRQFETHDVKVPALYVLLCGGIDEAREERYRYKYE